MKPKEKAIDLIGKYYWIVTNMPINYISTGDSYWETAKQCALKNIDEILEAIDWHEFESPNKEYEYWAEVIEEINKM